MPSIISACMWHWLNITSAQTLPLNHFSPLSRSCSLNYWEWESDWSMRIQWNGSIVSFVSWFSHLFLANSEEMKAVSLFKKWFLKNASSVRAVDLDSHHRWGTYPWMYLKIYLPVSFPNFSYPPRLDFTTLYGFLRLCPESVSSFVIFTLTINSSLL